MTPPEWYPSPLSGSAPPHGRPYAPPSPYPNHGAGYPSGGPEGAGPPFIPGQRQVPVDQGMPPGQRGKKATGKIVLAGVAGLLVGLLLGTALGAGGSSARAAQAQPQRADAPARGPGADAPAPGPLSTLGPGTYQVGTGAGDALPGTYKSPGPEGGIGTCYYGRLKNNDGSFGDILSNNISQGPSLFTLKPSDGYIEINGCTFTRS